LELFIDGKRIREEENLIYLGVTLDKKLTGKAHFQNVAEKAKKRIRLMQRAAGVSWGAKVNTIMLTYRTYVRPIVEYGTEVFATTADNRIEILNKVQNQALRIASGAVKTTPIVAMEAYCKVEPLLQRLHQRAMLQFEKMVRVDASRLEFLPNNEKRNKSHITFTQKTHELRELFSPELQELPRQGLSLPSRYTLPAEDNSITPNLEIEEIEKERGKEPNRAETADRRLPEEKLPPVGVGTCLH
jgi:hypothetical protein